MPIVDRIGIRSERGAYEVLVGAGVLGELGEVVARTSSARVVALVSDSVVAPLHAGRVVSSLRSAGFEVVQFDVPAGESSKDWDRAGDVVERMAAAGLRRADTVVVALGGGVVGDLAGFCASVYMRGVPVVQAPTTLLAQVDSAIGGKTGVDLPQGKNLAGTFWSPVAVVADQDVLATLPEAEWRSGLAEVAKSAILDGEASVATLEVAAEHVVAREAGAVRSAVLMAAGLKARVVSGDERESAARESLNYGHTLGHAIERVAGYGVVPHGRAVADGIRFAAALACAQGLSDEAWRVRQGRLLDRLGLGRLPGEWDPGALEDAMRADKKVRGTRMRFVLSARPGVWEVREVEDTAVRAALVAWVAAVAGH